MYNMNYKDFLLGQCAHCSQPLEDKNDSKMTTVMSKPLKYDVENFGMPFLSSETEITNFDAISLIYGISHNKLAEKLAENFKDPNREHNHEIVLESEANQNAKMCSSIAISRSRNLTFCVQCGLLFTEIFQIIRKFRNRSDENSLLSKTLHEQFYKIDKASIIFQEEEGEIKMEYNSTDFEDEPCEDPLMVDNNSCETIGSIEIMECNLENMKEEYIPLNEAKDIDNNIGSRSSAVKTEMRPHKRKQDLKEVVIVLQKLKNITSNPTNNSRNVSGSEFSESDVEDPENNEESRGKGRYSLRKKPARTNKVEISDDDSIYAPDEENSLVGSGSDFSESENNQIKMPKQSNSKNADGWDDTKRIHMKRRSSNSAKPYTTIPIKSKSNAPQKSNYMCRECGHQFSKLRQVEVHQLINHSHESDLTIHSELIKGPPYACPKCQKTFRAMFSLMLHCAKTHNLKVSQWAKDAFSKPRLCHKCSECELSFDGIRALEVHMRVHGRRLYCCYECDQGFLQKTNWCAHNMEEHLPMANSDEPATSHNSDEKIKTSEAVGEGINVLKTEIEKAQTGNSQPKIACKECGTIFKSIVNFKKHNVLHHMKNLRKISEFIKGPPYQCPDCDSKYKTLEYLKVHCMSRHRLKIETPPGLPKSSIPFYKYCNTCQENFENFEAYVAHYPKIHNQYYFHCESCKVMFKNKGRLDNHNMRKHPEQVSKEVEEDEKIEKSEDCEREICQEPFFCRECGFSFKTTLGIYSHNRVHELKTLDCKHCEVSFKYAMPLLRHLSSSHNVFCRPEVYKDNYWCTDCSDERAFELFRSLKIHFEEFNHSSYKVTCAFCEENFQKKGDLTRHKQLKHSDKLQTKRNVSNDVFKCPFCDQTFSNFTMELKHRATHPKEEQLYKCPHCPKTYTKFDSLRQHKAAIHSEEKFQCDECGLNLIGAKSFRRHCKGHAEKNSGIRPLCDLCGKTFISRKSLLKHRYLTHLRKEEKHCEICGYVSRTFWYFRRHMKVHEKNGIIRKRKKKDED